MNQIRLTARTFPARLPACMAILVGLYLLTQGAVFGLSGLLWIAGTYAACRAILSLPPFGRFYRCKRRELKFWKGWETLVGSLNWRNKKNRDDDDVPDPDLIAVDMSLADAGLPVQIIEFRPRPDSTKPRLEYGNWSNQLSLALGGHGMEYEVLANREGGPVIRVRIAMSALDAPPPLTEPPSSEFGVFPIGMGADGNEVAWHPFAHETQFGIFAGEPGTGKSSTLRLLAATPYQWDERVRVIVASPKPADFRFLDEERWKDRATIYAGPEECRKCIAWLREEVDKRNALLDSPEVRAEFVRPDGRTITRQPSKIHELSPEARAKHKLDFVLVILDELAAILSASKGGNEPKVVSDFRHIIAVSRAAGIMVALGIHRPDASIIGGYTRDLIGVRVLHGKPHRQQTSMLFEGDHDSMFDLERHYPPGTILYQGLGDPPSSQVRRGRVAYLDPDYLHPVVEEAGSIPFGASTPLGVVSHGVTAEGSERSWEERGRWWLRTGWATARLAVGRRVPVPVRDLEFRGTLLKTKALACAACGRGGYLEADHRVPLWAGGADDPHLNGQLLCKPHHARKSAWEVPARAMATGLPRAAMLTGSVLLFVAWVKW